MSQAGHFQDRPVAVDDAVLDGQPRVETKDGLDVFEIEPLPLDSGLRQFDSCIFGTHNSSNTSEAVSRVNEASIANLLNALEEPRSQAG